MQCNESHFVVADLTMSHTFGIPATICTFLLVFQTDSDAGAVAFPPAAGSAVLAMSLPDQYLYWLDLSRARHRDSSASSLAVAIDLA